MDEQERIEDLMSADQIVEVLRLVAIHDAHEDLWWHSGDPLRFFIQCSDVFDWGTADVEPLTAPDIPALRQAYEDCAAVKGHHGGLLYCARRRHMRPQGAYYKYISEAERPLFDACGPMRETSIFNPRPHPSSVPVQG